jgi:hypothetical protein
VPEVEGKVTGQLQHRPLGAGPPVLAAQARASKDRPSSPACF